MINLSRVNEFFNFQGLDNFLLNSTDYREDITISELVKALKKFRGKEDLTQFFNSCITESTHYKDESSLALFAEGALRAYKVICTRFNSYELKEKLNPLIKKIKNSPAVVDLIMRGYMDESHGEKRDSCPTHKRQRSFSGDSLQNDSDRPAKRLRSSDNPVSPQGFSFTHQQSDRPASRLRSSGNHTSPQASFSFTHQQSDRPEKRLSSSGNHTSPQESFSFTHQQSDRPASRLRSSGNHTSPQASFSFTYQQSDRPEKRLSSSGNHTSSQSLNTEEAQKTTKNGKPTSKTNGLISYMHFLQECFKSYVGERDWSSQDKKARKAGIKPIARNTFKRGLFHLVECRSAPENIRKEVRLFIDTMTRTTDSVANNSCGFCKKKSS